MNPEAIMVKEAFKRAIPSDDLSQLGLSRPQGSSGALASDKGNTVRYELLSQSDFLREFDVNSHKINSLKYLPNPLTKDDKKIYQKVKTRVAIAFQERIFTKRLTTLTGNNINLRIANAKSTEKEQALLDQFREGWEMKDIENAIYEALSSDGKTGDCAICFYMDDGKVGWRSFGFEKGDILYPHYDPKTGKLALFGRLYSSFIDGEWTEFLDVWDKTYYARYKFIKVDPNNPALNNKWVVDELATPHGFPELPIAYDRYGEPFWGNSQSLIEAYENAVSQLCENNMAYALRILYAFGAEMDMKSTLDGTPTQINSMSTDAKVGFLEPADASNSFTVQLETLEKNIMRSSFAVETPEIKSGADMSSLTVKMLFADAYQKALEDAMHFQPFLNTIVSLFKYGYGLELGRSSEFELFKVKAELLPYIFMSDTEQVSNIVQLSSIGAMSKRTASELAYELGLGVVGEWDRIKSEEHEILVNEAKMAAADVNANIVNQVRNAE